ncbi:hypothetical protein Tco_1132803, partial [Tanacetum coccineum]
RIEHEHDELPETPPPETTTYLDRKIETSNVQAGLEGNKVAQKEPSETANVSLDQSYMGSKNLEAPEDSQQSELNTWNGAWVQLVFGVGAEPRVTKTTEAS